jgi:hypothetical protein
MKDPEITAGYDKVPDRTVAVRDLFGIDSDMRVPMFSSANEYVPEVDDAYRFDPDTTLAILRAGGGKAELGLRAHQPGQLHQPGGPDWPGCHRLAGW